MVTDFFHMGGYAVYVWPTFIIAIVILAVNIWLPWRKQKKVLQQAAALAAKQ